MKAARHVQILGPMGLCFLTVVTWRVAESPPVSATRFPATSEFGLRPLRSPADAALRESRWWRVRAMQQVSAEFDALEAWDPEAPGMREPVVWYEMMARDRGGHLARAREAARRGLRLARDEGEVYSAGLLLTRIYCEAGDHRAELAQARRLMATTPRNELSVFTLYRAARCNHLQRVAARAVQQLEEQRSYLRFCTGGS